MSVSEFLSWSKISKCPVCGNGNLFSYHDVPCKTFVIICCNNANDLNSELNSINESRNKKLQAYLPLNEVESLDSTEIIDYIKVKVQSLCNLNRE